jgi:hypothetical protein
MPDYRVIWEIDLEAKSPLQAALEAEEIMKSSEGFRPSFTVREYKPGGGQWPSATVDLEESETPRL